MPQPNTEPPFIQVTNPVTYLRRWWDKVMGKEGAYFSFRVPPITAFLIAFGFALAAFGIGRYSVKIPLFGLYLDPTTTATRTSKEEPETWKETAYIGTLKYSDSTRGYFLVTSSASEAITLDVPRNLDLSQLVERRILVVGKYSKSLRTIQVLDAKDMEILPKTPIPIPTLEPLPSPTLPPAEAPTPEAIMVE